MFFIIIIVALVSEFAHRGHPIELHTFLDFFRGVGFLLSYWFSFVFVGVLGIRFRGEKKPENFIITKAKISAVRAWGVRRLFKGGAYSSKYVSCLPHFLGKRIELEIMGAKSC